MQSYVFIIDSSIRMVYKICVLDELNLKSMNDLNH